MIKAPTVNVMTKDHPFYQPYSDAMRIGTEGWAKAAQLAKRLSKYEDSKDFNMKTTVEYIESSHEVTKEFPDDLLNQIAETARICYRKEDSQYPDETNEKFVKRIIKLGHESVLEHFNLSAVFMTSRGVTHEFVRHRHTAYTQESTRYVGYGNKIVVIIPAWFKELTGEAHEEFQKRALWQTAIESAAEHYSQMLGLGHTKQEARGVLPHDVAAKLKVTTNLREWRHIFRLRCAKDAHPDIRELLMPLLEDLVAEFPELFQDVYDAVTK